MTEVCDLVYAISEDGKHVGGPVQGKGCDNITIDKDKGVSLTANSYTLQAKMILETESDV